MPPKLKATISGRQTNFKGANFDAIGPDISGTMPNNNYRPLKLHYSPRSKSSQISDYATIANNEIDHVLTHLMPPIIDSYSIQKNFNFKNSSNTSHNSQSNTSHFRRLLANQLHTGSDLEQTKQFQLLANSVLEDNEEIERKRQEQKMIRKQQQQQTQKGAGAVSSVTVGGPGNRLNSMINTQNSFNNTTGGGIQSTHSNALGLQNDKDLDSSTPNLLGKTITSWTDADRVRNSVLRAKLDNSNVNRDEKRKSVAMQLLTTAAGGPGGGSSSLGRKSILTGRKSVALDPNFVIGGPGNSSMGLRKSVVVNR